jgi:hypothetical protein
VEQLSWDKEIERLDRSYREVLAGSAGGREPGREDAVVNL